MGARLGRAVMALVVAAGIVLGVTALRHALALGAPSVRAVLGDPWTAFEVLAYALGIWIVTEVGVAASAARARRGEREERD